MSEDLHFSLEEMDATLTEASLKTKLYSEAITLLDETINNLADSWISTEVGTYEEFLDRYNARRIKRTFE